MKTEKLIYGKFVYYYKDQDLEQVKVGDKRSQISISRDDYAPIVRRVTEEFNSKLAGKELEKNIPVNLSLKIAQKMTSSNDDVFCRKVLTRTRIPQLQKENAIAAQLVSRFIRKNPGVSQANVCRFINKHKACLRKYKTEVMHLKNYENILKNLILSDQIEMVYVKKRIKYFAK